MTNITFDDNLITGNNTIDTQHEELINRIHQFVTACESGDGKVKAIKMLDYMDEYTNFHFQAEEDLQICASSCYDALLILIISCQIIQLSYPYTSSYISQISTFRSNASSAHCILP